MLVICEDCAKKYNIDESRIKGRRARFTCNECGHIIIIDKADLSRSLIQKKNEELSSSTTVDLLREMEAPFGGDSAGSGTPFDEAEPTGTEQEQPPFETKIKGTAITGYFLVGTVLSFLIITGGTGYIYSEFIAKLLSQQVDLRTDMIVTSFMVLGGGWILVFLLMFCLARFVSKSFVNLTSDAQRIIQGERDRQIIPRGPKEAKEMAQVIERMTKKFRSPR